MKWVVRSRLKDKRSEDYSWTTTFSIGLSIILLLASGVFSVEPSRDRTTNHNDNPAPAATTTPAPEPFVQICDRTNAERNNVNPKTRLKDQVIHCESTQPINWIINDTFHYPKLSQNDTELPFRIETKVEPCGSWQIPLSPVVDNSTISYYFTSNFTLFRRNHTTPATSDREINIFCSTYTRTNSTSLKGIELSESKKNKGKFKVENTTLQSPQNSLSTSSQKLCNDSELVLYQNVSSGNCSCESAELFHCDNLMECRFLAHWKYKKACKAAGFQNRCHSPSFSLSDSSKTKGGILFCESPQQDRHPYILFLPKPQKPEGKAAISMTTNQTESNLTQIQILGNEVEDYAKFLSLSITSPQNNTEITWKSGAQIECRGPAFLLLDRIFWNVTIENGESESNLLPKFNISHEKIGYSSEGEKYVSSTLTILPDDRNTSSDLNIICQVALSDGGVFVQSNRTVKLEGFKIKPNISCKNGTVNYQCEADLDPGEVWTWLDEKNGPRGSSFQGSCPTETISCIANLKNDVKYSYKFTASDCNGFFEKNCPKMLTTTTTTTPVTTTIKTSITTSTNPKNPTQSNAVNNSTSGGNSDHDYQSSTNDKPPVAPGGNENIIIAISASCVGLCLLIFIPCVIVLLRKNRKQRERLKMSDEDVKDFLKGNDSIHFIPYDTQLEIPRDQITIGTKVLGSGAFGKVVEGQYRDTKVAIKTVNKSADIQYFKALLSEIKIMGFVGNHENILKLVGACTWDIRKRSEAEYWDRHVRLCTLRNVYAVFELCENGNLVHFLRKNRNNFEKQEEKQKDKLLVDNRMTRMSRRISTIISNTNTSSTTNRKITERDLVRWSMEIASGMDIIAQKNIYHGDLAARNILLDENLKAKVGDFGLSRQLYEYSVYVQKMGCPLPLKWMSIESLRDLEFSIQSDVWSYGITLWEIFSLGCQPYPNLEWNFTSWKSLLDGERMEKPEHASNSIYEIMLKCWNAQPSERPTFAQLKTMFEDEYKKVP